jgi:glycosyltransferase involved in cell wall biosynthesis
MAQKIDSVLTNSKLSGNLKAAGAKQVAKYSWSKMAQQTLDAYKQALTK